MTRASNYHVTLVIQMDRLTKRPAQIQEVGNSGQYTSSQWQKRMTSLLLDLWRRLLLKARFSRCHMRIPAP
ncbi:hypothetical protein AOXY_G37193 [Acipenser oxyrinchus oxyrinchus]|uniref:Uncharacterized protein n=1 Tax=Acipenser oxyrinchus oxyrinchus TaxID=40147 RepID=A0AAD8CE34_ACIOX|nr:hypothetical protein AOXY_G37193 [Acipenser oxyrinchus oxyrinchus]